MELINEYIKKYTHHISQLFSVNCGFFDVKRNNYTVSGNVYHCDDCCNRFYCDRIQTHLLGCLEAQRWGNKYVYYCNGGLVFISIALYNEYDIPIGAIVTGPLLMGIDDSNWEYEDIALAENNKNGTACPSLSAKKVNDLMEILENIFTKNNITQDHTEDFLNGIYKVADEIKPVHQIDYPIELENELRLAISECDKQYAKELLNKLLGCIFFYSNIDLDIIKSRVIELIVLLSRATIEGGAKAEAILKLNRDYIKEAEHFSCIENLSIWLIGVLDKYMSYLFELGKVKHTDVIHKVIRYIKENYMNKITVEEIASHVYLSKSYLSKIFNDEMNCGITAYINSIRIEKGKKLLLDISLSIVDIANMIGFPDQSYFTRIFKNIVGVSPGKYREKHGRISR